MGGFSRVVHIVVPVWLAVLFAGGVAVARATTAQPKGDYTKIGEAAPGGRCRDIPADIFDVERCKGYPTKRFKDVNNAQDHRRLIGFLREPRWHEKSFVTKRARADMNPDTMTWPTHEVQAIKNPQKLGYKRVPKRGTVLARIMIARGSKKDKLYGIEDSAAYDTTYYLVSEPYKAADDETSDEKLGDRWRISTWSLYGIKRVGTTERLVQVGNTGMISWCGHGHNDSIQSEGASFLTCNKQEEVRIMRADAEAMNTLRAFGLSDTLAGGVGPSDESTSWIIRASQRLLRASRVPGALSVPVSSQAIRMLQRMESWDFYNDPVWMTCGVGCCIAET